MTWARAIILAVLITAGLIIALGFVPSIFRYTWANKSDVIAAFIKKQTGYEFRTPYTLVRIHDAISMGYQSVAFAVPLIVTYKVMEKRRRRSGQQGAPSIKGYLPGK